MSDDKPDNWDELRKLIARVQAGEEIEVDLDDASKQYLRSIASGLGLVESDFDTAQRAGTLREWILTAWERVSESTKRVTRAMIDYADASNPEGQKTARAILEAIAASDPVRVARDSAEHTLRPLKKDSPSGNR